MTTRRKRTNVRKATPKKANTITQEAKEKMEAQSTVRDGSNPQALDELQIAMENDEIIKPELKVNRFDLYDERTRNARGGAPIKIGEMTSKDFHPIGSSFKHNGNTWLIHERIVTDKCVKLFVK